MHPNSTCPPNALEGERQDQPRSAKMDELESRFWERESSDGGGGRSKSRGIKEMHQEGGNWLSLTQRCLREAEDQLQTLEKSRLGREEEGGRKH